MITHKAKNGNGTLIRRGGVYYAAWMFNGKKYRVSTAAMAAFPAIGAGAAERPAERAEAVEVAEIPAEAGKPAETRLDALARLLAEMDADEWAAAGAIFKAEGEKRRA